MRASDAFQWKKGCRDCGFEWKPNAGAKGAEWTECPNCRSANTKVVGSGLGLGGLEGCLVWALVIFVGMMILGFFLREMRGLTSAPAVPVEIRRPAPPSKECPGIQAKLLHAKRMATSDPGKWNRWVKHWTAKNKAAGCH